MISPADMKIIQIDITNACPHLCSNCTRFCGHQTSASFMDEETFRQAARSLKEFNGAVGIIGGEPTLHPRFERLMEIYREELYPGRVLQQGRDPIVDFNAYSMACINTFKPGGKMPALFTSLGPGYFKNFELIQELFGFQVVNDHANVGLHQALLVSRRDLGLSDEEWIPLRDRCWVQNLWSASITPKGAFFCEVAASLDLLFNGPGGWPVEPGWWRRTPEEFGDQLNWCELCSACLHVPRRMANEKVDTVSPTLYEKLKAIGSPKLRRGQVELFNPQPYEARKYEVDPNTVWFLPESDNRHRVSGTCESLKPAALNLIYWSAAPDDEPGPGLSSLFDGVRAVSTPAELLQAVEAFDPTGWIVLCDAATRLHPDFCARLRKTILNPGCLYTFGPRRRIETGAPADDRFEAELPHTFYLFHKYARALRALPREPLRAFDDFRALWPASKQIALAPDFDTRVRLAPPPSQPRHPLVPLVKTLQERRLRIGFFGAGQQAGLLLEQLHAARLAPPVLIYDDNPRSLQLGNVPVKRPHSGLCEADVLILATDTYAGQMTSRCRELWGEALPLIDLYGELPCGLMNEKECA